MSNLILEKMEDMKQASIPQKLVAFAGAGVFLFGLYSFDLSWVIVGGYIQERTFHRMAVSRRPCSRCEGDGYL